MIDMIFPEEKKIYETKFKNTKYIITSEALPDTREDILDSLTRLMIRDCGATYEPTPPRKPIDEEEIRKNFKLLGWNLIRP
jgi:hypothetical protein